MNVLNRLYGVRLANIKPV